MWSSFIAAILIAGSNTPAQGTEPTATVVEFYAASLNHCFITADSAEAAMLDAGVVVPGWVRTGVNECAIVKQNPGWTFEAIAFYIELPQNGSCRPGATPVYRSFYPGASVAQSNHRSLIDLTMFESMAPTSLLEGVVMLAAIVRADPG